MNRELIAYLRAQAIIAAAFNFFIGGMIAALIYHKADFVPTDAVVIDLTITCLLTFAITTPFCRAGLRRDKTGGVIPAKTKLSHRLGVTAMPFYRAQKHVFRGVGRFCVLRGALRGMCKAG